MSTIRNILSSMKEISTKLNDTGWQNLTLNDGIEPHGKGGSEPPQYKKIGNHVYVRGAVEGAWNGSNKLSFFTLPAGCRPANSLYRVIAVQGHMYARLQLTSSGDFGVEEVLDLSTGKSYTSTRWFDVEMDFEL